MMSINSNNNGSNKKQDTSDKKAQTPVQKQVSETKRKAHEAQYGNK